MTARCVEAEMREAVETGAPVDFEYRIIRPDGRVRRLHSRAELIADGPATPSASPAPPRT